MTARGHGSRRLITESFLTAQRAVSCRDVTLQGVSASTAGRESLADSRQRWAAIHIESRSWPIPGAMRRLSLMTREAAARRCGARPKW